MALVNIRNRRRKIAIEILTVVQLPGVARALVFALGKIAAKKSQFLRMKTQPGAKHDDGGKGPSLGGDVHDVGGWIGQETV